MDYKQFLLHPHLHPLPGGLPPPHCLLLQIQKASRRPQCRLRLPERQPGLSQPPTVLPLPTLLQSPRLDQAPYGRLLLRLPPSQLAHEGPQPLNEKTSPHRRPGTPHPAPTRRPNAPSSCSSHPPRTRNGQSPTRAHEKNLPGPPSPR